MIISMSLATKYSFTTMRWTMKTMKRSLLKRTLSRKMTKCWWNLKTTRAWNVKPQPLTKWWTRAPTWERTKCEAAKWRQSRAVPVKTVAKTRLFCLRSCFTISNRVARRSSNSMICFHQSKTITKFLTDSSRWIELAPSKILITSITFWAPLKSIPSTTYLLEMVSRTWCESNNSSLQLSSSTH